MSGLFAVVVIAGDWQTGHVDGAVTGSVAPDRVSALLRESNGTGLSVDLPHNFPCGHLQLRGHRDFVSARHTWRAAANELSRTQTSQNCELERRELGWTLYRNRLG